jgi:peptide/nickel transport system permease protein
MGKYVLRRLLIALVVLIAISMLDFGFINLAPGDPLQALLPPEVLHGSVAKLYEESGLTDSIPVRYLRWLNAVARGNLGTSFQTGEPTTTLIARTLPRTLLLTGSALTLAILLGVPLGILSALKYRSFLDEVMTVWSFVFTSIPGFFLALLAVFFFAVRLHWFPTGGIHAYDKEGNLVDLLHHLALPMVVLGLLQAPVFVRYVRASMLEVMRQDYIRTARAKGLAEWSVIARHALRNALIPTVTLIGLQVGAILEGAFITETIFAWPGVGRLAVQSIGSRDYPVTQAVVLMAVFAVMIANLMVDIAYAYLDPRINYAARR